MSQRLPSLLLALVLATSVRPNLATADPKLPMTMLPHAPAGYLLVDEDLWSQLMDETGRHLDRARDAFLHSHIRTTAQELRKASIMMRIDAGHRQDRADLALIKSAQELDHLANQLLSGQSVDTIDDVDAVSSRALTALAEHQHIKATQEWVHRHPRRSGNYLRAAADNLERAAFRARVGISMATSNAVHNARNLSGKLIEGTGYAIDEVGMGIDALGHQIEHMGQSVVHPRAAQKP